MNYSEKPIKIQDTEVKKAIIRIADALEDLSPKLDHLIKKDDFTIDSKRWGM